MNCGDPMQRRDNTCIHSFLLASEDARNICVFGPVSTTKLREVSELLPRRSADRGASMILVVFCRKMTPAYITAAIKRGQTHEEALEHEGLRDETYS